MIDRHLPNGPESQTPRRIIVHAMAYQIDYEGERLYAATFLERIGLSAHVLVAPDGQCIRCRSDREGAWHAKGFNTDSLGIEVLVPGVYDYDGFLGKIQTEWVGDRQLHATADVVANWCHRWGIGTEPGELDRHSDVSPQRKADPGSGFPWTDFLERVRSRLNLK